MINSVFISKTQSDVALLQKFCDKNSIELFAQSLITFESIPFQVDEKYDVVFFGSKRAIQFFLSGKIDLSEKKVGCVGEQTAAKLSKEGIEVDFIGKGSNMLQIANGFKAWLGDRKVLFPQSDRSLQSIQAVLDSEQVINLICYATSLKNMQIPKCDLYVFTSPSNAESFLNTNKIPDGAVIIAWGSSTEKFLKEWGVEAQQLEAPSLNSLIEKLSDLLIPE